MKYVLLVFTLLLTIPGVYAEEDHSLSNIRGTNIELKTYDHAIAGAIRDFVVWGYVDEASFTSDLIMRRDGQIVKATFKRQEDGRIGGQIIHTVGEAERTTEIYLGGVDPEAGQIKLLVNGQETVVSITSEGFEGSHFINPTYTTVIDGEEVSFTMENGEACFGLSMHLSMVIFGAYLH